MQRNRTEAMNAQAQQPVSCLIILSFFLLETPRLCVQHPRVRGPDLASGARPPPTPHGERDRWRDACAVLPQLRPQHAQGSCWLRLRSVLGEGPRIGLGIQLTHAWN